MKFAICNELFEGWEFERVCRFVKEVGYAGLEIAPFTLAPLITQLSANELDRLRGLADQAGIQIVGLHWLLAKTEGFHLTAPAPEVRRRTAEYLVELARACQRLGGSLMVFGSPQQRSLQPGLSHEQAMEYAVEVFGQVLGPAEELDVTICVEPLSPAETDFINTCEAGAELVRRLDRPNFKLHLDVKAMSSESVPVPELIRRFGSLTGHFHANDANRRGPGFGHVDFVPIFAALNHVRYSGWVSVEVFDFSPDPETIARKSLQYMKSCLEQI